MNVLSVNLPTPATTEQPESALMRELSRGSDRAMEELISRFHDPLLRLIQRLTAWSGDEDDLLQEVFVAAWQKADSFSGTGSLEGWLRRIAVNQCKNHYRKRQVFRGLIESVAAMLAHPVDRSSEGESRLHVALRRLSQSDREVITLFYLEELNGEDVAAILGISCEAVHMRLHRARGRLKKRMESTSQIQVNTSAKETGS